MQGGCYRSSMPAQSSRDRIFEALRDLPPDATVDDAIERLVFLAKIDAGLKELDAGKGIPHDEVKRRFRLGIGSSGRLSQSEISIRRGRTERSQQPRTTWDLT